MSHMMTLGCVTCSPAEPQAGRFRLGIMKIPPLVTYSILRVLAFLVPLAILWVFFPIFHEFWWLAAVFSALIGMSISILFLRRPLSEASTDIYNKRAARLSPSEQDAVAEDEEADRA